MNEGNGNGRGHKFGGNWTDTKLEILEKYLTAYTTALSPTRFRLGYVDAFAGTGYRDPRRSKDVEGQGCLPLPAFLDSPEQQELLDGSARIALQTEPSFDGYIFIEKNSKRCEQLEALRDEFPHRAEAITVIQGDANSEIQRLCAEPKHWRGRRAVLFLDPYGMQVEWETIELVAKTEAIDLWLLFPLGIGVNRLLKRSGDIPEDWCRRLDKLLGTDDWFDKFYTVHRRTTLFGDEEEELAKADIDTIGRYFNDRLASVFAGVARKPAVLRNSTKNPMYLLCFAVGNPRGKTIALRIANHLLRKV